MKVWVTRANEQQCVAGTSKKPTKRKGHFFGQDGERAFMFCNVTEFKKIISPKVNL